MNALRARRSQYFILHTSAFILAVSSPCLRGGRAVARGGGAQKVKVFSRNLLDKCHVMGYFACVGRRYLRPTAATSGPARCAVGVPRMGGRGLARRGARSRCPLSEGRGTTVRRALVRASNGRAGVAESLLVIASPRRGGAGSPVPGSLVCLVHRSRADRGSSTGRAAVDVGEYAGGPCRLRGGCPPGRYRVTGIRAV